MNNKQRLSSQSRVLVRILSKLPLKQIFISFPTKISEFFPGKSRKAEMKFSFNLSSHYSMSVLSGQLLIE